ncbi:MAG: AAA family ATPase [Caldilineaceae bacterium SB0665_bin_21]|nr:AAA family ATPase [Caldilineaceae bacterium SB0665_bin_21]MYA03062.1 AAA family ATPase [Caldilineaceae bacterium SB0664_bin_22]
MHNGRERPMQEAQHTQPFQITKVWARNFRSIANTSVELDRLTVLVGPNAAGKSNVLDILRFIKDALRFDLEAAIALRHGPEAIQRRTVDGQTSDVELGLSARNESGKVRYSLKYSFVLVVDNDGDFHVGQEYVRVHPRGLGKTFEIRIEEGRLIQFEWQSAASDGPRLVQPAYYFSTSELWLLARMWWIRDQELQPQPEWDEVGQCLNHFYHRMRETCFLRLPQHPPRTSKGGKCLSPCRRRWQSGISLKGYGETRSLHAVRSQGLPVAARSRCDRPGCRFCRGLPCGTPQAPIG